MRNNQFTTFPLVQFELHITCDFKKKSVPMYVRVILFSLKSSDLAAQLTQLAKKDDKEV